MPDQARANRIFTTWLTSTDRVDHAVTDEQFHDNRPDPEAVCGEVIMLAPMEWAPGDRCPRCVVFLAAREGLRDLDTRFGEHRHRHRHRRGGWLARLLHGILSPLVPRPRAGSRHERSEPPAAMYRPIVAAGPNSSVWPSSVAVEAASASGVATGTVVSPGLIWTWRDDHELPAAGHHRGGGVA